MTFPPPHPDSALTFDEVEDAGLDGTLIDIGLTPIQRLNQLEADYGPFGLNDWFPAPSDLADDGTFCLIERNVRSAQTWITLHGDAEAAVQYHYSQEYAEEWFVDDLLDLATGVHYEATHTARPRRAQ